MDASADEKVEYAMVVAAAVVGMEVDDEIVDGVRGSCRPLGYESGWYDSGGAPVFGFDFEGVNESGN